MNAKEKILEALRLGGKNANQNNNAGQAVEIVRAIALLQDCVVIPKAELLEGLAVNVANIEGNVDLGNFLQSDLNALIKAAQAILNHGGDDETKSS